MGPAVLTMTHDERIDLLAEAVLNGRAWGTVLLPDGYGGTRGATLNEAEEALCKVIDVLRERSARVSTDDYMLCYVSEPWAWFAFPPNPVGLHVLATTACNRWLSDGAIRPRWLNAMLPVRKTRQRVLAYMVENGMFDLLPAGKSLSIEDKDGWPATVGPFDEDRYLVHDFLQRHECAAHVKDRRAKDAARKRDERSTSSSQISKGVQPDVRADGARTPNGVTQDVRLAGGSAPARPHPDPTRPFPTPTSTSAATPQRSRADTSPPSRAETVPCPRCKAPAGEQCNGVRSKRKSAHLERHHAVGELTHITGKPAQRVSRPSGRAVKPYTPDPEMTRLRDEHFPGVEVTAVEGAAATLRFRSLPVTVDALRAVIFGAPGGDTAA